MVQQGAFLVRAMAGATRLTRIDSRWTLQPHAPPIPHAYPLSPGRGARVSPNPEPEGGFVAPKVLLAAFLHDGTLWLTLFGSPGPTT